MRALVADGSAGCGSDEPCIFRQDAPGVLRRGLLPVVPAAVQLLFFDPELECAVWDVESDGVSIAGQTDRPAGQGLRGDVSTHSPGGPPENRPSVSSRTSLPSPAPLMAPVIASISRIPGEVA